MVGSGPYSGVRTQVLAGEGVWWAEPEGETSGRDLEVMGGREDESSGRGPKGATPGRGLEVEWSPEGKIYARSWSRGPPWLDCGWCRGRGLTLGGGA